MSQNRSTAPAQANTLRSPLILEDLTADLIWPRLLKAGSLSLRPARLALGLFYLVGLAAIVAIAGSTDGVEGNALLAAGQEWVVHLQALVESLARRNGADAGQAINGLFIATVWNLVQGHPFIAIIFLPAVLIWTTLIGGAISRIAAMDFAQGVGLAWPEGMGYALGRWSSFAGSVAGPLGLVYAVLLCMAVAGWALFNLAGVNVVGGGLWFMFLIGSFIASVVMIAMTLGGPMLVPAVACEGTDAIDAVQHAYSYVFARPLRLVVYMAILTVQFALLGVVVWAAVWLVEHLAQHAAGVWVGDSGDLVIQGAKGLEGADRFAAGAVRFWTGIPALLGLAFGVSFFWCAATVLYLCMRRVCDGQDISEVWVDTLVPGTMAQRRPPEPRVAEDVIVDNGPADET